MPWLRQDRDRRPREQEVRWPWKNKIILSTSYTTRFATYVYVSLSTTPRRSHRFQRQAQCLPGASGCTDELGRWNLNIAPAHTKLNNLLCSQVFMDTSNTHSSLFGKRAAAPRLGFGSSDLGPQSHITTSSQIESVRPDIIEPTQWLFALKMLQYQSELSTLPGPTLPIVTMQ